MYVADFDSKFGTLGGGIAEHVASRERGHTEIVLLAEGLSPFASTRWPDENDPHDKLRSHYLSRFSRAVLHRSELPASYDFSSRPE